MSKLTAQIKPPPQRDHDSSLDGVIPHNPPPPSEGWQIAGAVVMLAFFVVIVVHLFREK